MTTGAMRGISCGVVLSGVALLTATPAACQQPAPQQQTSAQTPVPEQEQKSPPQPPPAAAKVPPRIRVGGDVARANIERMVQPAYPPIARTAHIQGDVILHAIIAKDGAIKELSVMAGSPLLMRAAMDAVRQWRYKPTLLNGEPVEVDTTITVKFTLDSGPTGIPNGTAPQSQLPEVDISTGNSENAPPLPRLHSHYDSPDKDTMDAEAKALAAIDLAFAADLRRLVRTTHTQQLILQLAEPQLATVQNEVRSSFIGKKNLPSGFDPDKYAKRYVEKVRAYFNSEEFANLQVILYAQHFKREEVQEVLKFYESSVGQRWLSELPAILADSRTQVLEHWEKVAGPRIQMELRDEFFKNAPPPNPPPPPPSEPGVPKTPAPAPSGAQPPPAPGP